MTNFGKPVIGPRIYLSHGPSSWPETFKRKDADEALQRLLGNVPTALAVEGFVRAYRKAGKDAVTWNVIVEHLMTLCRVPESMIEPRMGVAFWAGVNLALDAARAPKLN